MIEKCSPERYLEIFARGKRKGWDVFGNQAEDYNIGWETYANNSGNFKEKENLLSQLTLLEPTTNFKKAN